MVGAGNQTSDPLEEQQVLWTTEPSLQPSDFSSSLLFCSFGLPKSDEPPEYHLGTFNKGPTG